MSKIRLPLAAIAKNAAKAPAKAGVLNLKKMPIYGIEKEREHKEDKIYVTVTHSDKSVIIKLHDMSFGVRLNGTKYERHSHNVTNTAELKYAGLVMGHITARMKEISNDMTSFIAAIQALNITAKELHKDSVIAVEAIQKWLDEKYPYVEIHTDTVDMSELFTMCEGYAKIAYDLQTKCGTASSIRIIHNRIFPQDKEKSE